MAKGVALAKAAFKASMVSKAASDAVFAVTTKVATAATAKVVTSLQPSLHAVAKEASTAKAPVVAKAAVLTNAATVAVTVARTVSSVSGSSQNGDHG